MESFRISRKPCLIEEDNELAYLADLEAGLLGGNHRQSHKQNGFISSLVSSNSSSRSTTKLYDTRFEERQPHFLDACFLCKKPLTSNEQIFMYRGDTPFCSVECRYKQIVDEMKLQRSASVKALRSKDQRKYTSTLTTAKAHGYNFHTSSTIAAV